jgi:hypothetical protein
MIACLTGTWALVPERTGGQHRKAAGVPVHERDHRAVRSDLVGTVDRVGDETRLGLFAIGDHRRSGVLEFLDGVPQRRSASVVQVGLADLVGLEILDSVHQGRRTRNAADGFGRDRYHNASLP